MSPADVRLVLLASDGPMTRMIYHGLKREFPGIQVMLEDRVPRAVLFRRRLKTLGVLTTLGQVLFVIAIVPLLNLRARLRIAQIKGEFGLDDRPIDGRIVRVQSVNSNEARQVLRELKPTVVAVSGTRILDPETLSCVPAPFINLHAGVTPQYRGVHGAYWALREDSRELVGTTIHLIDRGVDTGPVIERVPFSVTSADSFVTYPYLHVAAGLQEFANAVHSAAIGRVPSRPPVSSRPSRLRSHPTAWSYVVGYLRKGVR